MVASIPKGVYTMKTRYVIIKHNQEAYKKASKKEKSEMINELSEILNMNRQYVGYLLRASGKEVIRKGNIVVVADPAKHNLSRRGRKRIYNQGVVKVLKVLWEASGYASSKHLVGFIRLNPDKIFENPMIAKILTDEIKELLLKISHATVDRLLKPYRDKEKLKEKYSGNPFSSNLKKSIKVESWFERPKEPGVVEIDLVHHSGVSGKGEFIYTLTATEISTGWTELRALKNKAMIWTKQALEEICKAMPIPIKKLHSDNGSEFINANYYFAVICAEILQRG
jgi:DNA-binding transcriptional ArsR family regulator